MRRLLPALCFVSLAAADAVPPAPPTLSLEVGKPFVWVPRFGGSPLSYRAEGLPPGLTVDPATGALGGTPTAGGSWTVTIFARNKAGEGSLRRLLAVKGAAAPPPPPPPPAAKSEEEDEADPSLASGAQLFPWTEYQRRSTWNYFLPAATTLPKGEFYYRISHVSRETYYHDWQTNLLGLDDNVKIGLMLGYGICDNLDVSLQRVNGYDLQVAPKSSSEPTRFDYYDLLFKWHFADQQRGAVADMALVGGVTHMLRNSGVGDTSLDAQLVIERNLFNDRLRLGTGIAHAGLSAYESTMRVGPSTKLFPVEYDYLTEQGAEPSTEAHPSTTAVPLTAKVAISERWALLGEAIYPLLGYRTHAGPSTAVGLRLSTHTHEFTLLFSNTANASFNGVITGGNEERSVNLFAFTISAFM